MKRTFIASTIFLSVAVAAQASAQAHAHQDVAKVTNVEPIYQTVQHRIPRETCWNETVRTEPERRRSRSHTPAIIGGVIGGLLGNEIGDNRDNKRIGAVVGTILGASIGSDIQRQNRRHEHHGAPNYEEIKRCEMSHTVETEQVLEGYDVEYRYRGMTYSTFMHEHPGKTLAVSVQVQPLVN